jgi:hypothetical protein
MDEVYSSRPDLMDTSLWDPELELYIDGSSFIKGGWRKAMSPQSPLLITSYRLKPYHKEGPHNELNFGHWSRHYNMQRESV